MEAAGVDVARLAAARAALDPQRRGWRGDIAISAIVEILSTRGSLTAQQLSTEINRLWGTDSVTTPLVEESLGLAERAYLVTPEVGGTWAASEDAKREAEADRRWVDAILTENEREFAHRLEECCETPIKTERVPTLFHQLLVALTLGAEGVYEAAIASSAPDQLRPVRFDIKRMGEYISGSVQPKSVARAVRELALAAADPHDDFGDEIVRLIMAGNILQGLLVRRDLPETVTLEGTRAVLDTSVLVYYVETDTPAKEIFESLIVQSRMAGVELVVAEHTLDEWESLWDGADSELRGRERELSGAAFMLIQNPFVKAFVHQLEHDASLTWQRFQIGRRHLRPVLEGMGISVRPHGNNRREDAVFAEAVRERLRGRFPRRRTATAASADGESCAMVARWREGGGEGVPKGWFIASDILTGVVYREIRNDRYPLAVTAESWLLFLAHMSTESGEALGKLASAISDMTARTAFLSVATAYTVNEALQLSQLLSEDETLSVEDLRAAVALDFEALIHEGDRIDPADIDRKATDLIRRRSARRDARAQRERSRAEAERAEMITKTERAEAKIASLEELVSKHHSSNSRTIHRLTTANLQLRRGLIAVALFVLSLGALLWMALTELLVGWHVLLGIGLLLVLFAAALRWVLDPKAKAIALVLSAVASAGWLLVAFVLERLATSSAP